MVDGEPIPDSPILVPPKRVVVRRSTDILAVDNPLVARALRFMWDNISKPLSVDEIAGAVEVSRRRLERAFEQTLGNGISAQLRIKRLRVVRDMLRETDMPVAEVARASGIGTAEHLHRTFRKEYDKTPSQYRKQARLETGEVPPRKK